MRRLQMLPEQIFPEELLVLVALPEVVLALQVRHEGSDVALAAPAELVAAEAASVAARGGCVCGLGSGRGLEGRQGVLNLGAGPEKGAVVDGVDVALGLVHAAEATAAEGADMRLLLLVSPTQ